MQIGTWIASWGRVSTYLRAELKQLKVIKTNRLT